MKQSMRRAGLPAVVVAILLTALPALAQAGGSPSDTVGFKMAGIRGDNGVDGANRAIDDYRFRVTATAAATRGGTVTRPQFRPFSVQFSQLGPGSPGLAQAVITGKHFAAAELDVDAAAKTCQPSGGERGCMRYCLYNVQATSVTHAGDGNKETAEFTYQKIGLIAVLQIAAGPVDTYSAGYDLNSGKTFTSSSC